MNEWYSYSIDTNNRKKTIIYNRKEKKKKKKKAKEIKQYHLLSFSSSIIHFSHPFSFSVSLSHPNTPENLTKFFSRENPIAVQTQIRKLTSESTTHIFLFGRENRKQIQRFLFRLQSSTVSFFSSHNTYTQIFIHKQNSFPFKETPFLSFLALLSFLFSIISIFPRKGNTLLMTLNPGFNSVINGFSLDL